jgi:hypothetical protein
MQFNLSIKQERITAFQRLGYYAEKGFIVDVIKIENTRTNQQNRALHKYFTLVAESLVEIGYDFTYVNILTGEMINIPFSADLVKNYIWRPLQEKIFEIESTRQLTTPMIDVILTALSNWLSDKGLEVNFPNRLDMIDGCNGI